MSAIKRLAGQTAMYGLPSIIGRVLNYFLVPLHTYFFDPKEYGIVSEFYAYVAFFVVLLMMGMETTFFRFVNQTDDKEKTFNQAFSLVLIANAIFLVTVLIFSQDIANWMLFPEYQNYVIWFAFILVFDATSSLFLAKLRYQEKAKKFIFIQFASIITVILLNLIFIFLIMGENDSFGIGYIFLANLCASLIKPILLYKDVLSFRFIMDKVLAKTMIIYSFPLVIAGFAGIINETFDRILIKRLLLDEGVDYAQAQVGIYSANYKLSILISLFIQAFRYAAEPFFFSREKDKDRNKIYAQIMTYFVIVLTFLFLVISLNLEIFKWFIPKEEFWEGLKIVPLLLLANVFLGIYYNQSIWYKLSNKTKYGAYIALVGAGITIGLNIILIPIYGYMGAAITTFSVYFSMMVMSYFLGKKHYPIKYNLRKVGLYMFSSVLLYLFSLLFHFESLPATLILNAFLLAIFIGLVLVIERPLTRLKKR